MKETDESLRRRLIRDLDESERKANDALARYKFQMFGYWSSDWVKLNRRLGLKRPNPWRDLVHLAREKLQ